MFLNRDPELPAFVIAVVEDTRHIPNDDPEQPWKWGTVTLDLGDCNRRVSFDFNMDTTQNRTDSLYKIRRLAEAVNAVREAVEIEAASHEARPAAPPQKEEK